MRMRYWFMIAVWVFATETGVAKASEKQILLPEGYTLVNVSATEENKVSKDWLVATLMIEKEDTQSPQNVQSYINAHMQEAESIIKNAGEDIEIETGHYSVHPQYDYSAEKRRIKSWMGSQSITMRSAKPNAVLEAVSALQTKDFLVNQLAYTLSPELEKKTREALIEKTISALIGRGERIAKALGKKQLEVLEINLDAPHNIIDVVPYEADTMFTGRKMMSSAASVPKPVAASTESTVSMTITAKLLIKP